MAGSAGMRAFGAICWLLLGFQLQFPVHGAEFSPASVKDPAEWVHIIQTLPATNPATGANEGLSIVLADDQVNVATGESYHRVVRRLVNETGLQNGAQIIAHYDPTWQQLTWNHIIIRRGQDRIQRLDASKIKTIQQEPGLDQHVYQGTFSAVYFVEDARVGDEIDFAYTLSGVNPILRGHFAEAFFLQYAVPVQRLRYRVLWPANRPLQYKAHGREIAPTVRDTGKLKEFVWEESDLPAIAYEEGCPAWADPFPWVQLTDYSSWGEVANWAVQLFPMHAALPDELRARINEWRALNDPEKAARAALEFVQDQIRYLGIESGLAAHVPALPADVFQRRFGDCKDKSHLLRAILTELGLDATPALVSQSQGNALPRLLPSPFAFNHCIVRLRLNAKDYYVDPTRSQQRGPIPSRSIGQPGCCLLVQPGVLALTPIPSEPATWPGTSQDMSFVVRGTNEPSWLTLKTVYSGSRADNVRITLAATGAEELQKRMLNYYARFWPGILVRDTLRSQDDVQSNVLTVIESYAIPQFWKKNVQDPRLTCEFGPLELLSALRCPSASIRTMPLAIDYPSQLSCRIHALLPRDWPTDHKRWGYTNSTFLLSAERSVNGRNLMMAYQLSTRTNLVAAAAFRAHSQLVSQVIDTVCYTLFWNPSALAQWTPNWPVILLAGFCLASSGGAGFWVYRRQGVLVPPFIPNAGPGRSLRGIGGWLILVAIALIVNPVGLLASLAQYGAAYRLESWHLLTTPGQGSYHALWAPTLLFELLSSVTFLCASILLLMLFFQKRSLFPRAYIMFLVAFLISAMVDFVLSAGIPAVDHKAKAQAGREVFRAIVACSIWIPYMLSSKRVKATFVR